MSLLGPPASRRLLPIFTVYGGDKERCPCCQCAGTQKLPDTKKLNRRVAALAIANNYQFVNYKRYQVWRML
jgi:hypothetical protein